MQARINYVGFRVPDSFHALEGVLVQNLHKAVFLSASAFVVRPEVSTWWNEQYSENENGNRRISL